MKKIVVTGGSGRAGRAAIPELLAHGYEVINLDIKPPAENLCPFRDVDVTDYGQVFATLHGYDAVVHMAADPRPDQDAFQGSKRFYNNTVSTHNIFNAAAELGMQRVVWASSETVLGLPFNDPPAIVPITEEDIPLPNSSYALSKLISEEMARQYHRWSGITFVGLRFSNIMYEEDYARFPSFWDDPASRRFNLWGYIDARDVAQSIRLGLEADITGAEEFIIAAKDTVMNRPSVQVLHEIFPGVPIREGLGEFDSLISTEKAQRMLGYTPQHSWRDTLTV